MQSEAWVSYVYFFNCNARINILRNAWLNHRAAQNPTTVACEVKQAVVSVSGHNDKETGMERILQSLFWRPATRHGCGQGWGSSGSQRLPTEY